MWCSKLPFDVVDRTRSTEILAYRGSHSHGTYIPPTEPMGTDDTDLMGITVGPLNSYFGLHKYYHEEFWVEEYDVVVYEIRKFFNLLLKSNPNVLGILWLRRVDYLRLTPIGERIINARDLFSSREAYHSFVGYAHSQLKRMERHNRQGYMGEKRKRIVDQFGYDTKNAAHLIRLLRMGVEFLREGKMEVYRRDAEELIAIKSGKRSLESIKEEATELFQEAIMVRDRSPLPEKPDTKSAEELLVDILKGHFSIRV